MELSGSSEVGASDVTTATMEAPQKARSGEDTKAIRPRLFPVETDRSRDALLTDFGKETLKDRYLLPRRILSGSVRPSRVRLRR